MRGFQTFLAPAKVNLFLHITGRRADGYHLLQSVFRLIDFNDTLRIKVRKDGAISRAKDIANVPEQQDLCIRAALLLQQHTGCALGADIAVDKYIPMGGGLGGGSSDAASVLLALNSLWQLNLSREELMGLGLKLGADVPFFIFGENAWVEGVGEQIQPIALPAAHYVILTPQVHVATAEIFSAEELTRDTIPTTIAAFSGVAFDSDLSGSNLPGKDKQHGSSFHDSGFHNDLESVVSQRHPAVASCLDWLSQFSQARMSGSGASVFVELKDQAQAQDIMAQVPRQIAGVPVFAFAARGLDRHPLYNQTV